MKIKMTKPVGIEVVIEVCSDYCDSEFVTFDKDEILTGVLLEDYTNMIDFEVTEEASGRLYGLSKNDFIVIQS